MAGSSSSGRISGVAERYASALFDLAKGEKKLPAVEKDMDRLDALLKGSDDLMRLVRSPVFSGEEQTAAIGAVLDKAKITGLVGNFVRVVADNRRLFAVPDMIRGFREKMAEHRGETSADVTVAHALSAAQNKELKTTLKSVVGKDVALDVTVDPSLLGGMVVKIGSRQIDTSLKTKLASMKQALKEVG
ncbi:MAG: F0F1 ATP synthase subunit delta [Pseudomonadota bacterium]